MRAARETGERGRHALDLIHSARLGTSTGPERVRHGVALGATRQDCREVCDQPIAARHHAVVLGVIWVSPRPQVEQVEQLCSAPSIPLLTSHFQLGHVGAV